MLFDRVWEHKNVVRILSSEWYISRDIIQHSLECKRRVYQAMGLHLELECSKAAYKGIYLFDYFAHSGLPILFEELQGCKDGACLHIIEYLFDLGKGQRSTFILWFRARYSPRKRDFSSFFVTITTVNEHSEEAGVIISASSMVLISLRAISLWGGDIRRALL